MSKTREALEEAASALDRCASELVRLHAPSAAMEAQVASNAVRVAASGAHQTLEGIARIAEHGMVDGHPVNALHAVLNKARAALSQTPSTSADDGKLREALKPFAEQADQYCDNDPDHPDDMKIDDLGVADITVGDCRRARAALKSTEGEPNAN